MSISNEAFYSKSNLLRNPFRANALYNNDPHISVWAGYDDERLLLEKFLIRSRAEQVGNTNLVLLYGDYGTGKSHALLWGANWLNKMTERGKSVAYYIPTLKKDKGKLGFSAAFIEDLVDKTSLLDDLMSFRQFLRGQIASYCEKVQQESDDRVIEKLILPSELARFAQQVHAATEREDIRDLIAPKGLTDYQAVVTFSKIVNLFTIETTVKDETKLYRQSVHLMIDELDVLTTSSPKEVIEANELIRHLYDFCPNRFGLILAVSAEQEIIASLFAPYVLSRIQKQIQFRPFDRDTAVKFITQIMDSVRVNANDQTKKGAFPFEQDALETIMNQLQTRTPRNVVNVMLQVLEELRLADIDPSRGAITTKILEDTEPLQDILY
jgi:hypothetical protein